MNTTPMAKRVAVWLLTPRLKLIAELKEWVRSSNHYQGLFEEMKEVASRLGLPNPTEENLREEIRGLRQNLADSNLRYTDLHLRFVNTRAQLRSHVKRMKP